MKIRWILGLMAVTLLHIVLLSPAPGLAADPYEPNNTLATATPIPLPFTSSNTAEITSGDVDFYKFSAKKGDIVNIDIDVQGSGLDSTAAVFDSLGNQLAFSDDDPAPGEAFSSESFVAFLVPSTGTYFIQVAGFNPTSSGTYQLHARLARFTGGAQGVGLDARGAVTITGAFTFDEPLDLAAAGATATIESLLGQAGVDLVGGVPITLNADSRNTARTARYQTPAGSTPSALLTIGARSGQFTFRLEVSGATITVPTVCPDTFTLSFSIDDQTSPPGGVAAPLSWVCYGTGKRYMKTTP